MSNTLRTTLLLGAMTALIVGIGGLAGGQSGMLVALLIAGATNLAGYWFSDKIVLATHGAREVAPTDDPALNEIVHRLSRAAGLPTPRIYLIESDTPKAFATGRNPRADRRAHPTAREDGAPQTIRLSNVRDFASLLSIGRSRCVRRRVRVFILFKHLWTMRLRG
jgi:Zn-dependent protease with chaperone function